MVAAPQSVRVFHPTPASCLQKIPNPQLTQKYQSINNKHGR
jgi:hypothetical protein